jgi:hypothetical protein
VIDISKPVVNGIDFVGAVVFWVVVGGFALWVLSKFFGNIKALKEA